MSNTDEGTSALPTDPVLAEVAVAVENTGHWAFVVDAQWNAVYVTDEIRWTFGGGTMCDVPIGHCLFGSETLAASKGWSLGLTSVEHFRTLFRLLGGSMLADASGDRGAVRAAVAPELADLIDGLESDNRQAVFLDGPAKDLNGEVVVPSVAFRVRRPNGELAGTVLINKVAPGMGMVAALVTQSDPRHLQRMLQVSKAGRRPAAILFADLESSTLLSRRMSTAAYFALGRRLVRAADLNVIDAGGIVGRHVGDGVVAFFLAETLTSESAAARACISAARSLRTAVGEVAARSHLDPEDVVLRFGLHWGSTLYVGNISTAGRHEVTALGDEVNEAARIEACAGGGRALASKALIERLEPNDALALNLDPDRLTYVALADIVTAPEKARRDAPAVTVCDV